MKSEHRHDLQTNELSKLAEKLRLKLAPIVEEHGTKIMVGAVILAGAIWFGRNFLGERSQADAASWREVQEAALGEMQAAMMGGGPLAADDYSDVAEDYEESAAAAWAALKGAETRLAQGIQDMFRDRATAVSSLEEARDDFRDLIEKETHPVVHERALFGLARSEETLSQGDLDAAIDAYEKLLKEFPDSVYQETATNRVAYLKTGDAMAFYAWFSKKSPKPPEPGKPADGGFPSLQDAGIPSLPKLPDLPTEGEDASPKATTETEGKESSEADDETPKEKAGDKEKAGEEEADPPGEKKKEDGKPDASTDAPEEPDIPEEKESAGKTEKKDSGESDTETADEKPSDGT